jgi:hypothetical protein
VQGIEAAEEVFGELKAFLKPINAEAYRSLHNVPSRDADLVDEDGGELWIETFPEHGVVRRSAIWGSIDAGEWHILRAHRSVIRPRVPEFQGIVRPYGIFNQRRTGLLTEEE